jgi:hypothetical protein
MLDSLTFIGEKEYAEGAAGLAAYWKRYLDSDPGVQLCALAYISRGSVKSDAYLLERILENFSDQELKRYAGRLIVGIRHLSAPPKKTKIVLLDDWTISGSQMRHARGRLLEDLPLSNGTGAARSYTKSLEINLLTASEQRIHKGLEDCEGAEKNPPVKAYFMSHKSDGRVKAKANGGYTSGTHSSVDYDFIGILTRIMDSLDVKEARLPRLAIVARPYKNSDRPGFHRVQELASAKLRAKNGQARL